MPETLATHENVEAVRYDKDGVPGAGAHHLYEVDPNTGAKKHLGSDEYLQSWGYDPNNRLSNTPTIENPDNQGTPTPTVENLGAALPAHETATHPGVVQYERGNQTVVNNAPVFNNNPHNENNIGQPLIGGGIEPPPQPIGEIPGAPGETDRIANLEQQIAQLREQLENQNNDRIQQLLEQNNQILQLLQQIVANQQPPQPPEEQPPAEEELPEEPEEPEEQGPTPEEQAMTEAEAALNNARDELLRFTIRRSTRVGDRFLRRRIEDREGYDQAMGAYREALDHYLGLRQAVHAEAVGDDEMQLRQLILQDEFDEERTLANREFELNNQLLDQAENTDEVGRLRARKNRFVRRWANLSTTKKLLIGAGLGAGVALASATGGAGLALLITGTAARFSLGLLNRTASARNVSERSLRQELRRIDREQQRSLLSLTTDGTLDEARAAVVDRVEHFDRRRVERRQNRNKLGTAFILGGVVMGSLAAAGLEIIPGYPWGGNKHGPGSPDSSIPPGGSPWETGGPSNLDQLTANFHPDSFYGRTPNEAVGSMFDVIQRNNINIQGLTPDKIDQIANDMMNQHWHIASGMENSPSGLRQHIVDAAKDWADGQTSNADASGLQGLEKINGDSTESWRKFMELAQKQGVTFTKG